MGIVRRLLPGTLSVTVLYTYLLLRAPSQARCSLASSPIGRAKGRALPARRTEIFAPGFGEAVDKTGWVRYTIDEKGTTSKAVPQRFLVKR